MSLYQTIQEAIQNPTLGVITLASDYSGSVTLATSLNDGNAKLTYRTILCKAATIDVIKDGQIILTQATYNEWAAQCRELKANTPKAKPTNQPGQWQKRHGQWVQQF